MTRQRASNRAVQMDNKRASSVPTGRCTKEGGTVHVTTSIKLRVHVGTEVLRTVVLRDFKSLLLESVDLDSLDCKMPFLC